MTWQNIRNLEIYQLSMKIGDDVYKITEKFEGLNKHTLGYQLIRAADSIAANIAEGYGRFHFRDQVRFCYIARGSLFETKVWLEKAKERVNEKRNDIERIIQMLDLLHLKLNAYIKHINNKLINQ
ncbi:MAG: four helix bundle protein [Bacteroidales bacterium]|nr:four helix bundle protein [Bacteroidales bacterium]